MRWLTLIALTICTCPLIASSPPAPIVIRGHLHAALKQTLRQVINQQTATHTPDYYDLVVANCLEVLHSMGYFDATVQMKKRHRSMQLWVHRGVRYVCTTMTLRVDGALEHGWDLTHLFPKKPWYATGALGETLLENITTYFQEHGYPFCRVTPQQVLLDRNRKQVTLVINVVPGPLTRFGQLTTTGLRNTHRSFIEKFLWAQPNTIYDGHILHRMQQALYDTGLFRHVAVNHGEKNVSGHLPITVALTEEKMREIVVKFSLSAQHGPGVEVDWTHKQPRGMGDTLALRTLFSKKGHEALLHYRLHYEPQSARTWYLRAETNRYQREGFIEKQIALSLRWSALWTRRLASEIALKASRVRTLLSTDNADDIYFSVPTTIRWTDSEDELFFRGHSYLYTITPNTSLRHSQRWLIENLFEASHCHPVSENIALSATLTLRGLVAQGFTQIPLTKRLYGGGAQYFRGYGQESVRPLVKGLPVPGGQCLWHTNFEIRTKIYSDTTLAPFLDIGQIFIRPGRENQPLTYSSGISIRKKTIAGTIRLDVAQPMVKAFAEHLKPAVYLSMETTS